MKNITLLIILILFAYSTESQTIAWSSDSEDWANFTTSELDGDDNFWGVYAGGAEDWGFSPGALFFSESYYFGPPGPDGPLDPDNLLFTPAGEIIIPGTATTITFKLKVAASDPGFPAEKFAVYVYDEAFGPDLDINNDVKIFETTLAVGGNGSAMDIMAPIPLSFAGKTIGIIVRHYDSFDQNQLWIDDFEVSYEEALSTKDIELDLVQVYPNPFKDIIKIDTNLIIDVVTISNLLGQNVMQIKNEHIINNSVNLSTLSKGLYLMTIDSENKSRTIKIIKE